MDEPTDAVLERALACYPALSRPRATPIAQGWIHRTWRIDDAGGAWVLQQVNEIFSLGVHANIEAVTTRLAERGVETPRLCSTRDGALYADLGPGRRFRLMTWVHGIAHDTCGSIGRAASAGRLVGRFHSALEGLEHDFAPLGFTFHEPAVHFAELEAALRDRAGHRLHAEVAAVADRIRGVVSHWKPLGPVPDRVVHLDLKFNNILFRETPAGEQACCLIDLDTLSRRPLWVELGDAWRSWCNLRPEHESRAEYAPELFEASAGAWLDAVAFQPDRRELESLAHAVERLCVELASRFAADALHESYFGWKPELFQTAGDHNLSRARGQLSLHDQTRAARADRMRFLLG